jgi:hypothetical protein
MSEDEYARGYRAGHAGREPLACYPDDAEDYWAGYADGKAAAIAAAV